MNRHTIKPPRIATKILEFIIQKDIRYGAMGDIEEQFYWMRKEHGLFKARLLYWKQIGGALPYFIKNTILWSLVMFKNYEHHQAQGVFLHQHSRSGHRHGLHTAYSPLGAA
jgi:hypothetical protein